MSDRNQLTAAFVASVRHSGRTKSSERHGDGGGLGLMLNVQPGGGKSWVQCLVIRGERRTFGIGAFPLTTLKQAREIAFNNKRTARAGRDPVAERDQLHNRSPTFRTAAEEVMRLLEPQLTSPKSIYQWRQSLTYYVYPVLGRMRVDAIKTSDVLAVLQPIWAEKRETASRVRQRISAAMRWSMANGFRADDPAATEVIMQVLPKRRAPVNHFPALPYPEVGAAIKLVRQADVTPSSKLALEFLVLTATRSGEVRKATWREIDIETKIWTIPAERMKARRTHRVPLSNRALHILKSAASLPNPNPDRLIFPSPRGKVLRDDGLSKILRDLKINAVPHGFRSTFRDWASEQTSTPHAVMEAALAHVIPNASEAAYARSDLLQARRKLMQLWAGHVAKIKRTSKPAKKIDYSAFEHEENPEDVIQRMIQQLEILLGESHN